MGRDAEAEKFRVLAHPELSTAVSNRTAAMLARLEAKSLCHNMRGLSHGGSTAC